MSRLNEFPRSRLSSLLEVERGPGPILATSLHDGHVIRPSLLPCFELSDSERLREEDPFTRLFTTICENRIVPRRSRFEVDLNRPASEAVYKRPEDAWGLRVWRRGLSDTAVAQSMAEYRAFYRYVGEVLEELEQRYGCFAVLDLHTYNHRRNGPGFPEADPSLNPEVNIGTGSMDRRRWASVVDRFVRELSQYEFRGRHLDVRENVRFTGGYFSRWVHEHFPVTGCVLAIELKKFFMDEWSGTVDMEMIQHLQAALKSTIAGLTEELFRKRASYRGSPKC